MHTITLNIDNSIYGNFKSLLELLPKDKITIEEDNDFPEELLLSLEEAKKRVAEAMSGITQKKGIPFDQAFEQIASGK
jgi:hypothetical protein